MCLFAPFGVFAILIRFIPVFIRRHTYLSSFSTLSSYFCSLGRIIIWMSFVTELTLRLSLALQTVAVSTEWPSSGQSDHPRQGQCPERVAGTPRQSTELRPRHLADRRPDTVRGARVTALHPADGHSAQTVAVRTVTRNDPALWMHYLRDQSRAG